MRGCGSVSTSPTTAPASTAGPRSRGCGRSRASWRPRWPRCCGSPQVDAHLCRADRRRRARARAGGARRPRGAARGTRAAGPPAERLPGGRRARAPGGRGAGRLRRAVLGDLAAVRLPGGRPARGRGPAAPRSRAGLAAAARRGGDERRGAGPGGRARLRGVLQAARGRDDDPQPDRPALGAASRTGCWWRTCGPTRSATAWCARWSAACSPSARAGATAGWAAEVLAAARRDSAVTVAPAHGLTLEEVAYPPDAELAARVEITRARRG